MARVSPPTLAVQLTEREMEILRMFARRLSNREIANTLTLSVGTVKWYAQQIFSKLGVSDRHDAVARAQTLGLLDESDERRHPANLHNLPAQLTSFVGRQREITAIKALLNATRLLTLTGPGGIGKTRLALEAASEMVSRFADGVFFVSLSPVSDPTRVASVIAGALGVREIADQPLAETLKGYLSDRQILLILDNFEHLMPAAPLIPALLMRASQLQIIVTSREVLHVPGEQEYLVPPLQLPEPSSAESVALLGGYEAIALFVQRAKAVRTDFALTPENAGAIVGICQRLDCLPLALELAAARVKLFTPQVMLSRLDSALSTLGSGFTDAITGRQQTLRTTLNWSYDLLDDSEKLVFNRLAVFTGGASLHAVDAICADLSPLDILNGLSSLVDKSLLLQHAGMDGEPRFWMLQTIREYALEKLDAGGEAPGIRTRHARYFLDFASAQEQEIFGECPDDWLDRLEEEHGNLRAALDWLLAQEDVVDALRLLGALGLFWLYRGHSAEGFRWAERIIPEAADAPPAVRAKALILPGSRLAYQLGKHDQGIALAEDALQLARQAGDAYYEALALGHLGLHYAQPGSESEALRLFQQAHDLFCEVESGVGIAWMLMAMGILRSELGQYRDAEAHYAQSLALYERLNSAWGIRNITQHMGITAYYQGQYDRATNLFKAILASTTVQRAVTNSLDAVFGLALVLKAQGHARIAARLFAAVSSLLDRLGTQLGMPERTIYRSEVAALQTTLGPSVFQEEWDEGRNLSLEQAIEIVTRDWPDESAS